MQSSIEQYADDLVGQYKEMRIRMPNHRVAGMFREAKASLIGEGSLSISLRRAMLESYRLAEVRLFGEIVELPLEQELLKQPLTEAVAKYSGALFQGNPAVKSFPISTHAPLPGSKDWGYTLRRGIVFVLALCIGMGLTWRFCDGSVAYLLFLIGCALIQLAGTKIPWFGDFDALAILNLPPLFLNPFVRIVVHVLAVLTLAAQFAVGLACHNWGAALFLWIPPLVGACGIFDSTRPNPSVPFFLGIVALGGACVTALS